MERYYGVQPETIKYKKIVGLDKNLPYVFEMAFGIKTEEHTNEGNNTICGLNWTPALRIPIDELQMILGEMRIDIDDPVCVVLHLVQPKFDFVDRGKGAVNIQYNAVSKIRSALMSVGKQWKKIKLHQERVDRATLDYLRHANPKQTYIDAAFEVMEQAINKASSEGKYLTNARQIMYAARPLVQAITKGKLWKDSAYFTQNILKTYLERNEGNPIIDCIVWDSRGNVTEPFTKRVTPLGGAAVTEYIGKWNSEFDIFELPQFQKLINIIGPKHRFQNALFIEKEGFDAILRDAGIAEKFDIAIMSTKGIPNMASCQLISELYKNGVKVFVLHDFDLAGFKIARTLKRGTRLSSGTPIIDIGLRLSDIQGLESEQVIYNQDADPRYYLRQCEATEEECNFLVDENSYHKKSWSGQRVELNAMTSDQLISWLERKLQEQGVQKVIPDESVLINAYKRAVFLHALQKEAEVMKEELMRQPITIPNALADRVREITNYNPISWDEAISQIAEGMEVEKNEIK